MPGPRMGPRPPDFDEELIRQSPTFVKWESLATGVKMRYACREFTKGFMDDEERLMRRIMIARRNNIKDHQVLKRAREEILSGSAATATTTDVKQVDAAATTQPPPSKAIKANESGSPPASSSAPAPRRRRPATLFSDAEVSKEMDAAAVEATRSYRTWLELSEGDVFVYNQRYIKGREGHDWLLRKNIWRRMKYRRENKKMVEKLREIGGVQPVNPAMNSTTRRAANTNRNTRETNESSVASQIIDQTLIHPDSSSTNDKRKEPQEIKVEQSTEALSSSLAATSNDHHHHHPLAHPTDDDMTEAVEAAVAVAESYTQSEHYKNAMVHNALDDGTSTTTTGAVANSAALDAAARLAASSAVDEEAIAVATAALSQTLNQMEGI